MGFASGFTFGIRVCNGVYIRMKGSGFRVSVLRVRISGFEFRTLGIQNCNMVCIRVPNFGFRVSGLPSVGRAFEV